MHRVIAIAHPDGAGRRRRKVIHAPVADPVLAGPEQAGQEVPIAPAPVIPAVRAVIGRCVETARRPPVAMVAAPVPPVLAAPIAVEAGSAVAAKIGANVRPAVAVEARAAVAANFGANVWPPVGGSPVWPAVAAKAGALIVAGTDAGSVAGAALGTAGALWPVLWLLGQLLRGLRRRRLGRRDAVLRHRRPVFGHALGTIVLGTIVLGTIVLGTIVLASFGAPLKGRITPAVRLGQAGHRQHGDGKRENRRTQHKDLHFDAFLLGPPKTRWK